MADAHTPLIVGTPWFSVVADEVCGKDSSGDVFVIAQLNPLQEMPDEVTAHHSRLIAAAPDLLEALKECAADFISEPCTIGEAYSIAGKEFMRRMQIARAAIAKATGEAK